MSNICYVYVDLAKVCGVDLIDASHEQAVEAIRRAGDTVVLLVQSGQHRSQVLRFRKQPKEKHISNGLGCIVQCICRYAYITLCSIWVSWGSRFYHTESQFSGYAKRGCSVYSIRQLHQKFQQCCGWEFVALQDDILWTQSILNKIIFNWKRIWYYITYYIGCGTWSICVSQSYRYSSAHSAFCVLPTVAYAHQPRKTNSNTAVQLAQQQGNTPLLETYQPWANHTFSILF